MVDKIVEIVPGLAAIGGIASIGAITEKFAGFGQKMTTNARLVGMNTRELMKYEYAARRAGQSSESIVSTLGNMQGKIRSAALGQSPEAMAQLLGWGINLKRDSHGSVTNMNDVVLQVMDKINRIPTAAGQSYAAGIFGASGSLPMIQQGTYRSDMARASQPGFLPSDRDIAKGNALNQQLTDLDTAFDTLKTKIGAKLDTIVGPIVTSLTKFLRSDNAVVAAELAGAFTALFSVISVVKVVSLTGKLFGLGRQTKTVADTAEAAASGLSRVTSALLNVGGLAALGVAGYAAESARASALDKSVHQLNGETAAVRKDRRQQCEKALPSDVPDSTRSGYCDGEVMTHTIIAEEGIARAESASPQDCSGRVAGPPWEGVLQGQFHPRSLRSHELSNLLNTFRSLTNELGVSR